MTGSQFRALKLATRIGYICRMARLERGVEIDELAARAGLSERAVRTLERGEGTHQTIDVMAVVAWALDFEWELGARDAKGTYTASGMEAPSGGEAENTGSTEGDSPVAESETPNQRRQATACE